MPATKPGDIWMVDSGRVAKVRPCVILTSRPRGNALDVFSVVAPTTAVRGSHWKLPIPQAYLADEGAFDRQSMATVASVKLERMPQVLDLLAGRLST